MPISGLVVSLVEDQRLGKETIESIRAEPHIEVGVIASNRMAVVLDTPTSDEDKRLWCWLSSLPGVVFVDVAMVAFEEPVDSDELVTDELVTDELVTDELVTDEPVTDEPVTDEPVTDEASVAKPSDVCSQSDCPQEKTQHGF